MADITGEHLLFPCHEHGGKIDRLFELIGKINVKIAYMTGAAAVGAGIGGFLAVIAIHYLTNKNN